MSPEMQAAWDMRSGADWMDPPPGHFRVTTTPPLFFYQGLFVGGYEIALFPMEFPNGTRAVIGWGQPNTSPGTLWGDA